MRHKSAPSAFPLCLAAAASKSAHDTRNGKVIPVARGPGAIDDSVYSVAPSRPLDGGLSACPSDLLGVHLEGSVFIHRPGQPGHVLPLVPRDKAGQRVVWPKGNVPVQSGAATNDGPGVKCVQPGLS
jgi:hypothetical protein